VIEIPTSRVKLLVGPNGTTIGSIQKKSKARVQIKKAEEDLNRAWGTGSSQPVKMPPGVSRATVVSYVMLDAGRNNDSSSLSG